MERQEVESALQEIRDALDARDWDRAAALVEALKPPDQADFFDDLAHEEQDRLLPQLELEDSADILEKLEEEKAAEVAARLTNAELFSILSEMEPDEAADLLGDLTPARAAQALATLAEADEIRPFLAYPDETAGGLMTAAEVILHEDMLVEEAIAHLRAVAPDAETVYYLFVVDRNERLVGVVSLRQLVVAPPRTVVGEIMDPDAISVDAHDDQEVAARLMARYDLVALPVVDSLGRMLGVITHDDLVEVLEEEATEDIFRLGGVPEEHAADVALPAALRARLPWLVLNLITAMMSALVLSLFEGTIARVAVLAAFFPMPFMPVYGPSKTFILNFSLALRAEMGGTTVSVSALCPNGIRTNGEAREKIEAHGFIGRLVSLDADEVVACALKGMLSRKAVIVPGFINQILAALGRHTPRFVVCPVVSAFYGKTAKGRDEGPAAVPAQSWSWI